MNGKLLFILIISSFSGTHSWAQQKQDSVFKKNAIVAPVVVLQKDLLKSTITPGLLNKIYCLRLGIMCRQELKLDKLTKTSFRFRLGSVEDTDKMEGKFNTHY